MKGTDAYCIVLNFKKTDFVDYRYSTISVLSIPSQQMNSKNSTINSEYMEPIKARLLGQGVVELYRQFDVDRFTSSDSYQSVTDCDDTIVAIIAIPTYFTATDILGFIGDSYLKHMSHIRIIKSDKPNRFLLLFKFREIFQAAAFQNRFSGRPFNLMEPETCHAIFVKSVKISSLKDSDAEATRDLIPFLLKDPFTKKSSGKLTHSPNKKYDPSLLELPTCPVCLERMDSDVSGLLTIPCQHTFHCRCLSKWKDDSCPICRYSNTRFNDRGASAPSRFSLLNTKHQLRSLESDSRSWSSSITPLTQCHTPGESEGSESCISCSDKTNLWICLVCGNIGCSRYNPQQHSLKHFVDTGHCFAMEADTSRVWDYASDSYVHRLVANEADGKLVELPGKNEHIPGSSKMLNNGVDKVDEVGFEYSQLLISQLASQREYYESLLLQAPKKSNESTILYLDHIAEKGLQTKVLELSKQMDDFNRVIIPSLRQKLAAKDEKNASLSHNLSTATSLNGALSKKVDHLEIQQQAFLKTIKDLKCENEGLKEQVTDLMFFLDNSEKFKHELQEAQNGTIIVRQPPEKHSRKPQSKRNSAKYVQKVVR